MRIDKFLKVSRLIKRREVAKQALKGEKILVNDKIVKPGYNIKIGDIITLKFNNKSLCVKVKEIKEHVKKDEAEMLYEVFNEKE